MFRASGLSRLGEVVDVLGHCCCTWLSKLVRHQPQECLHRDGYFYVLVSVSFVSRCVFSKTWTFRVFSFDAACGCWNSSCIDPRNVYTKEMNVLGSNPHFFCFHVFSHYVSLVVVSRVVLSWRSRGCSRTSLLHVVVETRTALTPGMFTQRWILLCVSFCFFCLARRGCSGCLRCAWLWKPGRHWHQERP